jgi:ATP-dependent Clp endopeptidase proteolytic subunit ClpP
MKKRIFAGRKDNSWFEFRAQTDGSAEVLIYDYIGWGGVEAKDFVRELKNVKADSLTVSMNTPGGDVFDGLAIYNALLDHPANITVRVDGLAASIGSIIMLAGDKITMAESAFVMIHNPWGFAMGGAADMRKMADTLDKVGATLRDVYVNATGKDASAIQALMDAETWFTADEAKQANLVDEVLTAENRAAARAAMRFDLSAYARVPAQLAADPSASAQQAEEEGSQQRAAMRRRLALVERSI